MATRNHLGTEFGQVAGLRPGRLSARTASPFARNSCTTGRPSAPVAPTARIFMEAHFEAGATSNARVTKQPSQ